MTTAPVLPGSPAGTALEPADVHIGTLTSADALDEASRLYRTVFGYDDPEAGINRRLLAALALHGGMALGARTPGGALIGFAYGFPGLSGGQSYLYSQAVVVAPAAQGLGLGRRLKAAQRDAALAAGHTRMRWSFDPVYSRNAHLNLDVVGAVGRWLHRDQYADGGSDRMVVEWDLVGARPAAAAPWRPVGTEDHGAALVAPDGRSAVVAFPDAVVVGSARAAHDVERALSAALEQLFTEGFAATSCVRVQPGTAAYVLERA